MKYNDAPHFVRKLIDNLIEVEGGYVNHNHDKGGETKYGITVETARQYGYYGNMEFLPVEIAQDIYTKVYYYNPKLDVIAKHSKLIAEEVFDSGVNVGSMVAIKWLQRSLNVFNRLEEDYKDIVADGIIGAKTEAALVALLKKRGLEGHEVLFTALNCLQGAFYIKLSEIREKNESFTYGWLKERVII